MNMPSQKGSFKFRAIDWLSLFRNQILLFSLVITATGFWMFAGLSAGSYPLLFICGMAAGLVFSAIVGIWYWKMFNEVLHEGPVILWNRYDETSGTIAIVTLVIVTSLPILALSGAIPGLSLEMTNSVFGGFLTTVFWVQLASIHLWELGQNARLRYDGMILELEKEGKNAPR